MNTNSPDDPPPNDERHITTAILLSSPAIITPDSPKNNEEKTPTVTTQNNNSMNGSSSLISLVAEDDTIPRDVRWKKEHRQFTDKTFAYIFIICYITFILSTIYVYIGAQPKYIFNGSGQSIISPYYANDVASCCAEQTTKKEKIGNFDLCTETTTTKDDNHNNNNKKNKITPDIETYNESNPRSLMYLPSTPRDHHHHTTTTTLLRGDEGIFEAFLDAPHIIIGLLILTIILAITWAILLQRAASPIVWATEAIKIGLLVYLGRRAAADDNDGTRNLCYGLATIQVIYSYRFRKSLRLAGEILSRSSTALLLGENKVVLLVGCGIVFLVYVANSWMFVVFYSKGYQHARVERVETCSSNDDGGGDCVSSCVFTYPSYMNTIYVVNCFVYGWSVFLLSQIRLSTIATIVGSWHFDDKANNNNNNNRERPSITRALINSTTTSLGTLSIAALISTICDHFNKELKKPCWKRWMMGGGGGGMMFCCFVSPVQLLLCFFGTALEMLIKMFSKFAVIVHVFTGLAYYDAGRKVSKIMSRHFVGGFVTEVTSESVLNLGCYVFSIGIMFLAWAWFDMAFGMDTLGLENVTSYVIMMVWVLFGLFNLWYPVLGIYLIILVNRYLQAWEEIKMRVHDEINESGAADKSVWGEWVQLLSTSTQRYWLSPLAAIFVGCVSMMFFTYVAGVFKDTIDVMFMCYAIDKDNNIEMSSSEMHSLAMAMGDDVVIAQPVLEQEHEKNFGKFYKNL